MRCMSAAVFALCATRLRWPYLPPRSIHVHLLSAGLPPAPGKIRTGRVAAPVAAVSTAAEPQHTLQERADALEQIPWTAPARLAHGCSGAAMGTDTAANAVPLIPRESGQHNIAVAGHGHAQHPQHAQHALIPGGKVDLPPPYGVIPEWELLHQVQLLLSHGVSPTHIAAMMSEPGYFSRAQQQLDPAATACDHIMMDLRAAANMPAARAAEAPAKQAGARDLSNMLAPFRSDNAVPASVAARGDAVAAGLPTAVGGAATAGEADASAELDVRWRELSLPASAHEHGAAGASSMRGLRSEPRCASLAGLLRLPHLDATEQIGRCEAAP